MPRLRQPPTMEDLALRASVKCLRLLGDRIMKYVEKNLKGSEFIETCVKVINEWFEANVPCYLFDRLKEEIFKEISYMVADIKKNVNMKTNTAKFIGMMHLAASLGEVVLTRHLRSLSL